MKKDDRIWERLTYVKEDKYLWERLAYVKNSKRRVLANDLNQKAPAYNFKREIFFDEEEKIEMSEEDKLLLKNKIIKKQYKRMKKEYKQAFAVVEANYIFNYFLTDIFPKYIENLTIESHNELLQGNISLLVKSYTDFKEESLDISNGLLFEKMLYSFADNRLAVMFKEPLIYLVFKTKLNQFLIKNQIIAIDVPKITKHYKVAKYFPYTNQINFATNLDSLNKALESGLQQIEEEKEDLKALMDTWNICENDIEKELGININNYNALISDTKKETKLIHKKEI